MYILLLPLNASVTHKCKNERCAVVFWLDLKASSKVTLNINQYKKTTLIFNLWTFPWIPSRQDNNPKNAVASRTWNLKGCNT